MKFKMIMAVILCAQGALAMDDATEFQKKYTQGTTRCKELLVQGTIDQAEQLVKQTIQELDALIGKDSKITFGVPMVKRTAQELDALVGQDSKMACDVLKFAIDLSVEFPKETRNKLADYATDVYLGHIAFDKKYRQATDHCTELFKEGRIKEVKKFVKQTVTELDSLVGEDYEKAHRVYKFVADLPISRSTLSEQDFDTLIKHARDVYRKRLAAMSDANEKTSANSGGCGFLRR